MQITEREHDVAQKLLRKKVTKEVELDEFDLNTLHTVVAAFRKREPVTEDIGNILYHINRKLNDY